MIIKDTLTAWSVELNKTEFVHPLKQINNQTRSYVSQENIALLGYFNPICMCPTESGNPEKRKNAEIKRAFSEVFPGKKCNFLNPIHFSVKDIDMIKDAGNRS